MQVSRIDFRDSAIYLKFYGIYFREWCLETLQNEAIGGKIYENSRIFAFELLI